jgi:ammonia channel protein AmtB
MGSLLTGVFADKRIMESGLGGWVNGHVINLIFFQFNYLISKIKFEKFKYMQVLYQLTEIVVCAAWSFVISYIILSVIKLIPFLKLRVDEDHEKK